MAVMKKDMSSTLHSNAELSRCHSRLAAAVKAQDHPTSLSLVADLASNVSSVLLMLPLPAKTDKGQVLALTAFRDCMLLYGSPLSNVQIPLSHLYPHIL